MPQAAGLAAELKTKFGDDTQVDFVEGAGGVFDVVVDGNLVFSKKQAGRFPHYQELPTAITMAGLG